MTKIISYNIKEKFNLNKNLKYKLWTTFNKKKLKVRKSELNFKVKSIRNLNQSKTLSKNWNILNLFLDTKLSGQKTFSKVKTKTLNIDNIFRCTPIFFSLKKELIFLEAEKNRQFFFFAKELYISLKNSALFLVKENFLTLNNRSLILEKKQEQLFSNYITSILYKKTIPLHYINSDLFLNKVYIQNMKKTLNLTNLNLLVSAANIPNTKALNKKFNLENYKFLNQEYSFWKNVDLYQNVSLFKHTQILKFELKKQKIISFIKKRNIYKGLNIFTNLPNQYSLKNFLWKRRSIFYQGSKIEQITNLSKLYNKTYNSERRKSSFQLLYIISRIESKILMYSNLKSKGEEIKNLNKLRNLLLLLLNEKKERTLRSNLILSKQKVLSKYRQQKWMGKLLKAFYNFILSNQSNIKLQNFGKLIIKNLRYLKSENKDLKVTKKESFFQQKFLNKISLNKAFSTLNNKKYLKRTKSFNEGATLVAPWKKKKLNIRRTWGGEKIILTEKHMTFIQKKMLLSTWIGKSVDIIFINALALTKFAFKLERLNSPNNNANLFLSTLDRDFINKYKYIGIYIKDLIRIAFISVFLKKPSFLAKFVAFQISKLPKNRKETIFIRFLIKVIKTFAAERKEILGVRIRFKGRVNRWRRTKFILGNRGTLPLQTISERIEQGTAQAVNRKGALGIRIWLRYKISFAHLLKGYILTYIKYSRALRIRRLKRNILLK